MSEATTIVLSSLVLILSFYALHHVTDAYFVQSLEILSGRLRLTSDVAGASLMAMGSSAPELFTSLLALTKSTQLADLGAGTIVGSAIFNILVIVGASAMFGTAVLSWQPAIRDLVFYILTILLLYAALADGQVTLGEALVFVAFYVLYLAALPLWRRLFPYADQADALAEVRLEPEYESLGGTPWYWYWTVPVNTAFRGIMPNLSVRPERYLWVFVSSIVSIALLSWVLVEAGVLLAGALGVPGAIIGLTVLAVGTSVPDLLSSMIVARQGKSDMAVSNAVGSNIFDILVGLGLVWTVMILVRGGTIPIGKVNLHGSVVLLLASVAALLFVLIVRRWRLGRRSGLVLVCMYGLYLVATVAGWL